MPDYPHRGPNISRIRLEGTGGFIYALTPVLILLLGAPLLLAGWLGLAAILVPFVYWRNHAHGRSLTHLTIGVSGFVFGGLALLVVGADIRMRLFALLCVAGGVMGAVLRSWRLAQVQHPSIRDHSRR